MINTGFIYSSNLFLIVFSAFELCSFTVLWEIFISPAIWAILNPRSRLKKWTFRCCSGNSFFIFSRNSRRYLSLVRSSGVSLSQSRNLSRSSVSLILEFFFTRLRNLFLAVVKMYARKSFIPESSALLWDIQTNTSWTMSSASAREGVSVTR